MRISYTRVLQAIKYLSKVKDELRHVYQTIQVKIAAQLPEKIYTKKFFRHKK